MSIRLLLAYSLVLTLTACGATDSSVAEGQSGDPAHAPAGQPETPTTNATSATAGEVAGGPSAEDGKYGETIEFVSFTPQAEEAAPADKSEDAGADEDAASDAPSDIVLLAQAISDLRTSIDSLREQNRQIMAAVGVGNTEADLQLTDPSQPSSSADSLLDIVMDLRDTVAILAVENETFAKLIQEQTTVLKPIPSVPTNGTLIVENNTDSDQYVWINGTGRWVWARTTSKVTVPVGEITTKLSGESQKTWEIKAPAYEEHIEFVQP